MNARLHPAAALAAIQSKTAIASEALADIQAMGRLTLSVASFNDDDAYVYIVATKQLVRQIGSKSLLDTRHGLAVRAGETWGKGMAVKRLGLWEAV